MHNAGLISETNALGDLAWPPSDSVRRETEKWLGLLENSEDRIDEICREFEAKGFEVHVARSQQECLQLLKRGCMTFVLDVDMSDDLPDGTRKVEGLATLQDIKAAQPDAFCAVVTGYKFHEARAINFGADYFCGKTSQETVWLADKVNRAYLRRRLNMGKSRLTMERVGEVLRREDHSVPSEQEFQQLAEHLRKALEYIDPMVRQGDHRAAAQDMVLVEPTLRTIARYSETLGAGFGIGIHALLNASKHVSQSELTVQMWECWCGALSKVLDDPGLSEDAACDLADELDNHGFNTEPPDWHTVTEMLGSLEAKDLHKIHSD